MSAEEKTKNVCTTCNRSFTRLAALENHVRLSHPVNEDIIRAKCQERLPGKKALVKKAAKDVKKSPGFSNGKENTRQNISGLQQSSGLSSLHQSAGLGSSSSSRQHEISSSRSHEISSSRPHEISSSRTHEISSSRPHEISRNRPQEFSSSRPQEISSSRPHEISSSNQSRLPYSKIIDAQKRNTQSEVIDGESKKYSQLPHEKQGSFSKGGSINSARCIQGSKILIDQKGNTHIQFQGTDNRGSNFQSLYEKAKVASAASTIVSRNRLLQSREILRKVCDVIVNDADGTYYCFVCKAYLSSVGSFMNHNCFCIQRGNNSLARLCRDCGKGRLECLCGHHVLKVTVEERSVSCEACNKWFPTNQVRDNHKCSVLKRTEVGKSSGIDKSPKALQNLPETVKNSSVKCLYCKQEFSDDFKLFDHMLSHEELTHFDCFFCRLVFSSGSSLKAHLKSEHDHQIVDCRKKGTTEILTESGVRYRCSLCPQTFTCKSNRRRHEHRHFGIRPHKCDLCGASFRQKWQLSTHKKSRRCQENIMKRSALQMNLVVGTSTGNEITSYGVTGLRMAENAGSVTPSGKQNTSPTPGSPAPLPNIASIPMPSLSTDISSSSESMCLDKKFQMNRTAQNGPLDPANMNACVLEGKGFLCKDCGKVCKTSRNLRIHRRIHTGERPYNCSMCSLTFRQSHHRKAHMLSQHGVNPAASRPTGKQEIVVVTEEGIRYKCHLCSKVLMSRSGRRKHERWHLGLRPHQCNNCGNTFKQLQHLKKHQKSSKCMPSRPSLMIPSPKKEHKNKMDSDSSASRLPLTSQYMLKAARRLTEVTANDFTPASDTQKTMDMPLALGLISVEQLKAKQEEKSKSIAQAEGDALQESGPHSADHSSKKIKLEQDREEISSRSQLSGLIEKLAASVKLKVKEEVLSEESSESEEDSSDEDEENGESQSTLQDDSEDCPTSDKTVPTQPTPGDSESATSHGIEGETEDQKPIQCLVCGQFYHSEESLKLHMLVHKEDRPYTCTLCTRTFLQPHHLGAHMKSTHKTTIAVNEEDEGILTEQGIRFKCQHCPKLLTSRNGRRKHERWHLGLRPYVCDVCGKAFKQSHHLKRHKIGIACIPPEASEKNLSLQEDLNKDDARMDVDRNPADSENPGDFVKSSISSSLRDKKVHVGHTLDCDTPVDLVKGKLKVDSFHSSKGNTIVKLSVNPLSLQPNTPVDPVELGMKVDPKCVDQGNAVDFAKYELKDGTVSLVEGNTVCPVESETEDDSIPADKRNSENCSVNAPPSPGPLEDPNGNITKIGLSAPTPSSPLRNNGPIRVRSLVCEETMSDCDLSPQDLSMLSSRN